MKKGNLQPWQKRADIQNNPGYIFNKQCYHRKVLSYKNVSVLIPFYSRPRTFNLFFFGNIFFSTLSSDFPIKWSQSFLIAFPEDPVLESVWPLDWALGIFHSVSVFCEGGGAEAP